MPSPFDVAGPSGQAVVALPPERQRLRVRDSGAVIPLLGVCVIGVVVLDQVELHDPTEAALRAVPSSVLRCHEKDRLSGHEIEQLASLPLELRLLILVGNGTSMGSQPVD